MGINIKHVVVMMLILCNSTYVVSMINAPHMMQQGIKQTKSIEDLWGKVEELQASVAQLAQNPSAIKSWLVWTGKVGLVIGGVSLTTYLAFRYVFDLASPKDFNRAMNRINQQADQNRQSFDGHVEQGLAGLNKEIIDTLAGVADKQKHGIGALNDLVGQQIGLSHSQNMLLQRKIEEVYQYTGVLLQNHAEGQQQQLNAFAKQFGGQFNNFEQQLQQRTAESQRQLENFGARVDELDNRTQLLQRRLLDRSGQLAEDRRLLQDAFNDMGRLGNGNLLLEN